MTFCAGPSSSTSCSSVFVPPMSPAMMRIVRAAAWPSHSKLFQFRQRLAPILLPLRNVLLRRQLRVLHGDGRLALAFRVEADLHARLVGSGEAERLRRGGFALLVLFLLRELAERREQICDRHVERARDAGDIAALRLMHLAQAALALVRDRYHLTPPRWRAVLARDRGDLAMRLRLRARLVEELEPLRPVAARGAQHRVVADRLRGHLHPF